MFTVELGPTRYSKHRRWLGKYNTGGVGWKFTRNLQMLRETHIFTITITTHFTLFDECIYNAEAQ